MTTAGFLFLLIVVILTVPIWVPAILSTLFLILGGVFKLFRM